MRANLKFAIIVIVVSLIEIIGTIVAWTSVSYSFLAMIVVLFCGIALLILGIIRLLKK